MNDVIADRRSFIGGSDIAAIIGESPWKDPYALYLEKRGEIEPSVEENRATRRGKAFEGPIAQLYAEEHGAVILPGTISTIPDHPHFRAQIDRIEVVDGANVPLEVKSASEFTRGKWGPSGTDDAPTYYCAQVHWQLLAMPDAPFGRLVARIGADDERVYTIERDAAIAKYLLEHAHEFWQRVQEGRAPPANLDHPSMADTLARLFRNPNATEIVQADDLLRSYRDVFVDAGEQIKTYEAVREGAKLRLLAAMRNAAILDFGDGQVLERKQVKRKGYVVADTTYVDARLKKAPSSKAGQPALTEGVAA